MDFSLVKQLFIPQGEVTKITNLEGITLWQKISRVLKEWRGLSPLTCTPTVVNPFEEVRVYGDSKQEPTRTINIFDKENAPIGGYLQANGEYSSTGHVTKHIEYTEIPQGVTKISRYTKDWEDTGSNYLTRISYYDTDKTPISTVTGFGTGAFFTSDIHSGAKYIRVSIGDKDVNGTVIYWGDETLDKYLPYIISEPTPDTPIEVQSVGDRTKNLLPLNLLQKRTSNGITVTPEGYGYRLSGEYSAYTQFISTVDISLEAGVYTLSGAGLLQLRNTTGATIFASKTANQSSVTFTLDEDTIVRFRIVVSTAPDLTTDLILPMLVKGDTETPFEPYGYRVPVTVTGKNLFDKNNPITMQGYYSSGRFIEGTQFNCVAIPCKPNTTYTISFSNGQQSIRQWIVGLDKLEFAVYCNLLSQGSGAISWNTATITTGSNDNYIVFLVRKNDDGNDKLISLETKYNAIQVEEGSTATSYQPYTEPTATNIYLPEPLRKIGTFADTLSVEGNNVTVVRNVKEEIVDNTKNWAYTSSAETWRADNYFQDNNNIQVAPILCNKYPVNHYNSVNNVVDMTVGVPLLVSTQTNMYRIYFKDTKNAPTTLTAFKQWLIDNEITIYYPLATPTTETFTIDNPINALDNTSIITVDTVTPPTEVYASEYVEE